nr:immunoglobulin heavy chain junction region [Macaca mulatta]MOX03892.1 immunoglobulin heavy chain junction region [Macaca mulatta]
CARHHSGFDSW